MNKLPTALVLALLLSTQLCLAQPIHVPLDYPTIQQAVDAASCGQKIIIAAGTYEEQVIIDGKNLRLVGDCGAVIQSPPVLAPVDLGPGAPPRRPVLAVINADRLDLEGLTFDGLERGDTLPRFTGVFYVAVGGTVKDCSFTGFRSTVLGIQADPERALQMVNPEGSGQFSLEFDVLDCSFANNLDSIFVGGNPNTPSGTSTIQTRIKGNVITGVGPTPMQPQTGIHVSFGAAGRVKGNTVTGHVFLLQSGFSIGIQVGTLAPTPVAMPKVRVQGNDLSSNTVGILALYADDARVVNNCVTGGPLGFGGIGLSGDGIRIVNNSIVMTGSMVPGNSGIVLLGAEFNAVFNTGFAVDTKIIANTITGASIPIQAQTGVTGTVMHANTINP